jgi:hypothetical protein
LGQFLGSDAGRALNVAYWAIDGHRLAAADRVVNSDFYAVLHPQDLRREDPKRIRTCSRHSGTLTAFLAPREKCAQRADPAAAGSGLAAKAFALESCFPAACDG